MSFLLPKSIYAGHCDKSVAGNMDLLQAKFMLCLAQRGFVVGTIKGYLVAFLWLPDEPSLFKSPVVMRFLRGLTHVSPPNPL